MKCPIRINKDGDRVLADALEGLVRPATISKLISTPQ